MNRLPPALGVAFVPTKVLCGFPSSHKRSHKGGVSGIQVKNHEEGLPGGSPCTLCALPVPSTLLLPGLCPAPGLFRPLGLGLSGRATCPSPWSVTP